ncbi:MAG: hypothetical protein ACHREM_33695, partial [Polyangiales bacterium]
IFTQPVDDVVGIPSPPGTTNVPPVESQPLVQLVGIQYAVILNAIDDPTATYAGGAPSYVGLPAYLSIDFVDLVTWNSAHHDMGFFCGGSTDPHATCAIGAPRTLIGVSAALMVIDAKGVAVAIDSSVANGYVTRGAPTGFSSYAEVAGATVLHGDDGSAYLLAGTGAAPSGNAMIIVGPDGTITGLRESGGTASGAAVWAPTRGIVVLPSDGSSVLAVDHASGAVSPLKATASVPAGAVVVALDSARVVEIDPGGVLSTIDLSCENSCAPKISAVTLPSVTPSSLDVAIPLVDGELAVLRGGTLTILDTSLSPRTTTFTFASPTTAIAVPTGQVLLTSAPSGAGVSLSTYAPPRT